MSLQLSNVIPKANTSPAGGGVSDAVKIQREIAKNLKIQDPIFEEQWHIFNKDFMNNMINVIPVWDMGIKGKGVKVSMIDDGLDSEDFWLLLCWSGWTFCKVGRLFVPSG